MSFSDCVSLIVALLALAITSLLGWQQKKLAEQQTELAKRQAETADKELFISVARDVHDRYSKLYPKLAALPKKGIGQPSPEQDQAISEYVNLCAEEYLWKQKGIIACEIWEVWEHGIREKFQGALVRQAWKQLHRRGVYYEGFVEFIDDLVATT